MNKMFQVMWQVGDQQCGSRLINQEERDLFVKGLEELGFQYLGENIIVADTAADILAKIKEQFPTNNNAKVIPLKVIK